MRRELTLVAAAALAAAAAATPRRLPAQSVDVVSYGFQIVIPDSGRAIHARATVVFIAAPSVDTLALDLVGMTVDSVTWHGRDAAGPAAVPFAYDGRRLLVAHPPLSPPGLGNVTVFYHGEPGDGLLLGPTARGERFAFADDWPERAREWLPTVDRPGDKAEVLWLVSAPQDWRVVANGRLAGEGRSPDGRTWWAYTEHHPIPTYTMVLAGGPFAVSRHPPAVAGNDTVPIEVWTYPQDSAWADSVPFRRATAIVETMQRLVGPFPYEKLAHVEAVTRFGGMENAAAIFYAEQAYLGRRMGEGVVRHETAHQWFGDAVTERDFHDLWLSEGFASYFDWVIGAALDGDSVLEDGMRENARSYFASAVVDRPVIDTTVSDPLELLDANSYQKGSWVLHMLRGEIGDSAFWRGIRAYYATYRDSSVASEEFERVMERACGRPLGRFFDQWLRQPGYPRLDVAWTWNAGLRRVTLDVAETQSPAWGLYDLPRVELAFSTGGRELARRTIPVTGRRQRFVFALPAPPDDVRVDPDGRLLLLATTRKR